MKTYAFDFATGQHICTAIVATMVRKNAATCGCAGQMKRVTLSHQAHNPTPLPIRLAIRVTLNEVRMLAPLSAEH